MKRALIAVQDTRYLIPLAQTLVERGFELLVQGAAAAALQGAGVPFLTAAPFSGVPDWMVVNFITRAGAPDLAQVGPALTRHGALAFERAVVLIDPDDYRSTLGQLVNQGEVSLETRRALAGKAMAAVLAFDAEVLRWLTSGPAPTSPFPTLDAAILRRSAILADPGGAALYREVSAPAGSVAGALTVSVMSRRPERADYLDGDLALRLVAELPEPAVAVRRGAHRAVFSAPSLAAALRSAARFIEADPTAAFVGCNREVDAAAAAELAGWSCRGVIAPTFAFDGLRLLDADPRRVLLATVELPCLPPNRVDPVLGGCVVARLPDRTVDLIPTAGVGEREHRLFWFAYRVLSQVPGATFLLVQVDDAGVLYTEISPVAGTTPEGELAGESSAQDGLLLLGSAKVTPELLRRAAELRLPVALAEPASYEDTSLQPAATAAGARLLAVRYRPQSAPTLPQDRDAAQS